MNRVVVTGIGAVSPLGNSFSESWAAAKKGQSGIGLISRFDHSDIRWKVAGELKGFDRERYLSGKEIARLDPFAQYAVAAALMAAEDAGLIGRSSVINKELNSPLPPFAKGGDTSGFFDKERDSKSPTLEKGDLGGFHSFRILKPELLQSAAVIIGSSRGGVGTLEKSIVNTLLSPGKRHLVSPYLMPSTTISMASSYIAQKLGLKGYCLGISNACASGANAIGEAYRLIRSGYNGPVFCGGAEAPICRICFQGYGVSNVLSTINDASASRPFDRARDGFVLSEGSSVLVLEEYENAKKRGAKIYGEIIGYGNTADAFHQTAPSPEGEAAAITAAIQEAGLKPEDIHFINAHAPSTQIGDKTETEAIKKSLGRKAYCIPVTSLKSITGHMLAASGAFEAAITLKCMDEGMIPPTINLKDRDPCCDLDYVTEPRRADIEFSISHSFGFGGVNAVLAFKKLIA